MMHTQSHKSTRDDQLRMKLMLYLGSGTEWVPVYATWCADNEVDSSCQLYEDHTINLFVTQQRAKMKNGVKL